MAERATLAAQQLDPLGRGLGKGKRRPRMSEQQTREAMLATALAAIQHSGLSLSLDDISMEDVIREAGVSRTTAYRCWPNKDMFVADLILALAAQAIAVFNVRQHDATELLRALVLPKLPGLADPATRWEFAAELIGQVSLADFEVTRAERPRWQTYFALLVMLPQLPEGDLRDQLRTALGSAEQRYRERLMTNHRIIAEILGFRLREPQQANAERVVELIIALWRGLIVRDEADDGEAAPARVSVTEGESPLSLPALGATAILAHFYEVDPTVDWDVHVVELRDRLSSDDLFGA